MTRLAFAALLLAAGCAESPMAIPLRSDRALPPPALVGCAEHAVAVAELSGRPEAEVRTALAAMPGIRTIRLLAPGQPATRDFRPDRVGGVVEDGVVRNLACG
ncbi:I78 family peptidase inhibitor [Falsiroseomonas sp. HC035]|uniref:I78 family peptidase inhibitor n=1 Tax=Falsiroseomonas sp. HC035 TaxID=3390999 RepID=UPI003D31D566